MGALKTNLSARSPSRGRDNLQVFTSDIVPWVCKESIEDEGCTIFSVVMDGILKKEKRDVANILEAVSSVVLVAVMREEDFSSAIDTTDPRIIRERNRTG